MNTTERKKRMQNLRAKGHTLGYIALQFGISRQRVCQIIGRTGRIDRDKLLEARARETK